MSGDVGHFSGADYFTPCETVRANSALVSLLLRLEARTLIACSLAFLGAMPVEAQQQELLNLPWPAKWIDVPNTSTQDYGIYHFRRTFDLPYKPEHFVLHVSGDNRYQLYANGKRVSWGPARSDLTHWRYETVDIAPEMRSGRNVLAAVVWNDGIYRAVAQVTNQTGFVLQADGAEHAFVNTGASWRCIQDTAYSPQPLPSDQDTGYHALGPNERLNANLYPWGWERVEYDDSAWLRAHESTVAAPRDSRDSPNRWMLTPRPIPLEELKPERISKLRKAGGVTPPDGFPERHSPFTIPAHTRASMLLDQARLTTAYPELMVSGGKGATITLRYAETLYIGKTPVNKGNRNDVEGKVFYGYADTYISDGGLQRIYRPLFWRTYRYLELNVESANEPIVIEDIHGVFTSYPFERRATFEVDNPALNRELDEILSTGWRTARLCAHETYMDCPYYEQLQYAGDARIQMMISLYMSGDARLMKNGIELLNSSRTAEGATYSRAPSYLEQYIPPFSLWWIGMVHDYWMYVDDPQFVREMLPGVQAILAFYSQFQKDNGSLKHMPWWNFVDWVKEWPNGEPPANSDGSSSAALDLQLLLAYQWGSELENTFGSKALADEYKAQAKKLEHTILDTDWDSARGLFADQPEHRTYSQQVNTLAVLAGIVRRERGTQIVQKVLTDRSLAQCSIYFRAYMGAALRKIGLGDSYVDMLSPWQEMLAQGLTTWSEWSGPDARSDCHAWGASPNYELFRTVAGIESSAPTFARVRITPNLGKLNHLRATMPHPKGEIRVDLKREGKKLTAEVDLPPDTQGEFGWAGKAHVLKPGRNHLEF
ncbi:MAG: family 78 glycoside hydrolase catalytic domain [Acidobacteriaceae bacterium]|nr:family 78 glycoside hydrolase catalytic domain [Acidobacteriaceae bacterium]MBV9780449.1 family 78 glycoside hydrolase catalytic domain [Acidobacteriaceae bacterium]